MSCHTDYKLSTGNTLRVSQQEDSESPRDWDNLGTMVCFHKSYNLGDKHDYKSSDYGGWGEMKADIIKNEDAAVILPLYLYDHSGITMNTTGFSCPWDSGQVGFIYASRKRVLSEIPGTCKTRVSPKLKATVTEYLIGEVETFDQYLTGDVYHFELLGPDEEFIDSCGGFYGSDPKENGMLGHVEGTIVEQLKAA